MKLPRATLAGATAILALISSTHAVSASSSVSVVATIPVGGTPYGIAVTPDGSRIFVSNSTSGSVSVIDAASRTVTSTISSNVGSTPVGITVNAAGTTAYVGNYTAGTVTRINVSTGTTNSLDVSALVGGFCAFPLNLVVSPDDEQLYIACQDNGRVIQVSPNASPATGTVLLGAAGNAPTDVALSADGSTLVSSLSGTSKAYVLDGTGPTEIPVTTGAFSVAISPSTGLAYLAGANSGAVSIVNTTTRAVIGSEIPIGGSLSDIAITPDGSTAVISVLDQNVIKLLDLRSLDVIHTVAVGTGPQSIAISSDGRFVYTANRASNNVSVVALPQRAATGEQVPSAPLQQFAISAEGTCDQAPDDFADFPALGERLLNTAWSRSWALWPNGGTGGFVCTRQPYFTAAQDWAVE